MGACEHVGDAKMKDAIRLKALGYSMNGLWTLHLVFDRTIKDSTERMNSPHKKASPRLTPLRVIFHFGGDLHPGVRSQTRRTM